MAWLYVPGLADSNSGCNSPSKPWDGPIKLWAIVSGTPTPLPASWPGWKRRTWTRLLCGTISNPSLAASTAEKWISSLPDSPASPSHARESAKPRTMNAGSGPSLKGWLARLDPDGCSWKTSQESLPLASPKGAPLAKSFPAWPRSGSMRNGFVYRRETWATAWRGSGSSCWPRPRASASEKKWPRRPPGGGAKGGPNQRDGNGSLHLTSEAVKWARPRANDPEKRGSIDEADPRNGLPGQTSHWARPSARDWKAGEMKGSPARPLSEQAFRFGRLDGEKASGGSGKKSLKSSPKLNPLFVEFLMGWPIGWSDCDAPATGWSLYRRRWLCWLSQNAQRLLR